jgi:hypothetical protein
MGKEDGALDDTTTGREDGTAISEGASAGTAMTGMDGTAISEGASSGTAMTGEDWAQDGTTVGRADGILLVWTGGTTGTRTDSKVLFF